MVYRHRHFPLAAHRMSRPAVFAVLLALALPRSIPALAAGVVGSGTPESCTEAALDTALGCGSPIGSPPLFSLCRGGSIVTFNCGPNPVTVTVTSTKGMISGETTIDGGGLITISGGNSVGVFSVTAGVTFTVQMLTIVNGNSAPRAGGAISNNGTLTVTNSTFSGNSSGAVSNQFEGTLTVTNSTFSGNSIDCCGGGISNGGTLTLTNSTFSGNSASGSGGGAIWNTGTVNVTSSAFFGNSAPGLNGTGGAISNYDVFLNVTATVNVTSSTFSGNSASGGGAIINSGNLTITSSTFSGNRARGLLSDGGGIYNTGELTVTNSTFSGNSASGGGGSIENFGTVMITDSTFSGNSADNGGGGIHNSVLLLAQATLINTILANNTGGNCDGTIANGGHDLDDGTSCGFGTANGSLSNTDPNFDPAGLANNGGPTQTIALLAASPAINAGDETTCAAAPVNNRDQRGYVRPGTGYTNCSIGAFEFDSPGPPSCDVGDCNNNSAVTVDEIITLVNIALGTAQSSECPYGVPSGAEVNVAAIIQAVNDALHGCRAEPSHHEECGHRGARTRRGVDRHAHHEAPLRGRCAPAT